MKQVIIMVGLPRSGKSTKAKEIHEKTGYPIVNGDSVRLALHGQRFLREAEMMVHTMTVLMSKALLLNHGGIIIDECNITEERRYQWRSVLKNCEIHFKEIKTSKKVCLKRANTKKDRILIPVIKYMATLYEPLSGLDRI